ncbi:RNA dependent RNA polymerase-domain-containing protein [Naematelia encephala]|uniref:RNA-dependent RNA polymerase n=1 Tax=Naematelia encephala TaxID=71784 RepID=A0A1Y2ANA4_9TREE|nr:RNA dependent RNA polymerase-domain-containing protein [Naematelia encephala]
MSDPSWSLTNYPDEMQQAYELLRKAPLLLPPFAPQHYESDTEEKIFNSIHRLLVSHTSSFPTVIAKLLNTLPRPPLPNQGRVTRFVDPKLHFSLRLEGEINKLEAERREYRSAIVDRPVSELGKQVGQEAGRGVAHQPPERAALQNQSAPDPLLPVYNTVSPSKRSSDGLDDSFLKRLKAVKTSDSFLTERKVFTRTETSSTDTSVTRSSISDDTIYTPLTPIETAKNPFVEPAEAHQEVESWKPRPALDEDERYVYVHPPHAWQSMAFREGIQYHVQWELQRLVDHSRTITWDDLTLDDIRSLKGSAPEAISRLKERLATLEDSKATLSQFTPISSADMRISLEAEREEKSIVASDLRGVGNDSHDWPYGGRLAYSIIVTPLDQPKDERAVKLATSLIDDENPYRQSPRKREHSPNKSPVKCPTSLPFRLDLCKPEISGKSFRLARRFGSRRIVLFKLAKIKSAKQRKAVLQLFVGRCFIIFGRSFRPLWAPADRDTLFAIETSEFFPNEPTNKPCPRMPTILDLLSMYNDLYSKPKQAMAKWAARPQILFSDSVPVSQLSSQDRIGIIPDIVSSSAYGEPGAEQILTDGAGLMSEALAREVFKRLCPQSTQPCAIQVRISGAKGMLVLMSHEDQQRHPGKDVLLRPSMIKAISRGEYSSDPSLLCLDVVRFDSLRIGTALTSEPIISMVHGGISPEIFLTLLKNSLDELRDALSPRASPTETPQEAIRRLTANVYRLGGVGMDAKRRQCDQQGLSSKVHGLLSRSSSETDMSSTEIDGATERWEIDPESKIPGSVAETLYRMLLSGFDPTQSDFACDKLRFLFSSLSDQILQKFRIPVANSLSAFIVPDPTGCLAPDEIHIAFSSNGPVDPITKCQMSYLDCDVLAFRSPCKLPTDVRKFKAVYKPELAHLRDCIVMSANSNLCKRSPASFLAGGDYDGDTVQLFWDEELVQAFTNAEDDLADVPADFVSLNFDKEVTSGTDFLARMSGEDDETIITNMQYFLLSGLKDDKSTGEYSEMHGNAVYKLGFDHPKTLRLARMFNHVLDARKSGLQVKKSVKKMDKHEFEGRVEWRRWKKEGQAQLGDNIFNVRDIVRPSRLGEFIMDKIMYTGQTRKFELLSTFPTSGSLLVKSSSDQEALGELWRTAKRQASSQLESSLNDQLLIIRNHVEACDKIWANINMGRHDDSIPMEVQYLQTHNANANAPRTPQTPTMQRSKSNEGSQSRLRSARMRQLAIVWQSYPYPQTVQLLCPFGRQEVLREIKVACAAEQEWNSNNKKKNKRIIMPFEMDFETVCNIKAKSTGATTVSILAGSLDDLKPSYKAPLSNL